ncbi:hypothetical protein [Streptomyces sp. NPDC048644]|uniref:hypothetical protein n=1 Tax=Streptomyces sp. NPDC048644 TaxID=3365582 RepID=UPI0037211C61
MNGYRRLRLPKVGEVRLHDSGKRLGRLVERGQAVVQSVTVSRSGHRRAGPRPVAGVARLHHEVALRQDVVLHAVEWQLATRFAESDMSAHTVGSVRWLVDDADDLPARLESAVREEANEKVGSSPRTRVGVRAHPAPFTPTAAGPTNSVTTRSRLWASL